MVVAVWVVEEVVDVEVEAVIVVVDSEVIEAADLEMTGAAVVGDSAEDSEAIIASQPASLPPESIT